MYMCVNMNIPANMCAHTRTCMLSRAPGPPQHDVQDADSAVHYVLLSASWAVLCYYAEDLRLKQPLQVWGAWGAEKLGPRPGLLITASHMLGAAPSADNPRGPRLMSSRAPPAHRHTEP